MNTTLLINYIDGLRQKRDLSQEPFIEGIISQRQYSRYKKGDNDVPFDVIIKLAERLSLSLSEVITAFEQSVTNESRDTKDFFNYVIRRDFKQAHKYEAQLSDKQFIKSHLKIYFFIARHILRYYEKKLTAEDLLVSLKKQIKYPLILDKETLSDMEIYALGLIMQHDKKEIAKIVDKLL
ncbi:MAG: helix-turn-helix domain-containing protein, partial [Bacillota bacterium]